MRLVETCVLPQVTMDNDTAVKLIKLYECYRLLWEPLNKKYYDRNAKQDAWNDMSSKLGIPVDACH